MKLLNDFFFIEETTACDGAIRCRLRINPQHVIYRAHFPGNPVTPGVCIVRMVTELLEACCGGHPELVRIVNVKFLHVLDPTRQSHVQMLIHRTELPDAGCRVKATLQDDTQPYAQLSMIYADAPEAR